MSPAVAASMPQTPGAGAVSAPSVATQPERTVTATTPDATRAELTALLEEQLRRSTDASLAGSARSRATDDAKAIRARLAAGDFEIGDRFVATITADSVRQTVMVVREGPKVELGTLPALELAGVLRAELEAAFQRHLARFYRSPEVKIQFLTRISVVGAVARPGTYSVPPDALVADVLAQAGGVSPSARQDRIVVLRGSRQLLDEKGYRQAVADGRTVAEVQLQPGDEIRVPERSRQNWYRVATFSVIAISTFTAVLALIRSSYTD